MSKTKGVNPLAITVKKEDDHGEWYHQLLHKADLIRFTQVSGCYVLLPNSFFVWEQLKGYLDREFKQRGVSNCYYPIFIPKRVLEKEKDHFAGFEAEVAWVTHGGKSELEEPIAVRPTSETIMYESFKTLIQSYQDLPLKLNQWCNVVRWEFSDPTPFIRSREFLWQEGHTAFSTQSEAKDEVHDIIYLYQKTYQEMLAVPTIVGRKTIKEQFAGAEETLTVEGYLPGARRGIQAATAHHLGQNFAKMFGLEVSTDEKTTEFVWQNSWGFSTRSLGVAMMLHSDNQGLVLTPETARIQIVMVPIFNKASQQQVETEIQRLGKMLWDEGFRVEIDLRKKRPGWKYNYWEMRGVPLRLELGMRDMEAEQIMAITRYDGKKFSIKTGDEYFVKSVKQVMEQITPTMYKHAREQLHDNLISVATKDEFKKVVTNGQLALTPWCGDLECEERIRAEYEGVKSLCIPLEEQYQEKLAPTCTQCGAARETNCIFGRSF